MAGKNPSVAFGTGSLSVLVAAASEEKVDERNGIGSLKRIYRGDFQSADRPF